jgi:hypothetical protein
MTPPDTIAIVSAAERAKAVTVAVSGETVQRQDQCTSCREPMLYRCHENGEPYEMFCSNAVCCLFLIEVPL